VSTVKQKKIGPNGKGPGHLLERSHDMNEKGARHIWEGEQYVGGCGKKARGTEAYNDKKRKGSTKLPRRGTFLRRAARQVWGEATGKATKTKPGTGRARQKAGVNRQVCTAEKTNES